MSVQYDNGYIMSSQSWWYVIMLSFRGDVIMIVGDTALLMENVRIYVTMVIGYMWHCLFYERGNFVIMIISDTGLCMKSCMLLRDIFIAWRRKLYVIMVIRDIALCMEEEVICYLML